MQMSPWAYDHDRLVVCREGEPKKLEQKVVMDSTLATQQ